MLARLLPAPTRCWFRPVPKNMPAAALNLTDQAVEWETRTDPAAFNALSIVYFGNDWFGENRTSSHHIARRLVDRYKLLYVEVPGLRAPEMNSRDLIKLWRKLRSTLRRPRPIGPRMWHMTLPQIPFRRFRAVRALNHRVAQLLIRRAMNRLQLQSSVSWFVVPHAASLAGLLGEKLVVYYCIDDYSTLPNVDRQAVAQMDTALSRRADLVFASSRALFESKTRHNSAVTYAPHGVDVDLFRSASDRSRQPALPTRALPHPVVGFFGVVDERIDTDLLLFLSRERPGWTFLLVGRIAIDQARLTARSNIFCPGTVPYLELAEWARAFDVCMMPYRLGAFATHANPLKLREYLATGKPVVSVRMPEVESLGAVVEIADTAPEFLRAIDRALADDCDERRQARVNSVAPMTWDRRVQETIQVLERRLGTIP